MRKWLIFLIATALFGLASPSIAHDCECDAAISINSDVNYAMEIISTDSQGLQDRKHSKDGTFSANAKWASFVNASKVFSGSSIDNIYNAYLKNLETNELILASPSLFGGGGANANVFSSVISPNGRWVAFTTFATNLTSEGANGARQLYIYDAQSQTVELASKSPSGLLGDDHTDGEMVFSPDSSKLVFLSDANNLNNDDNNVGGNDIFIKDMTSDHIMLLTQKPDYASSGNASYQSPVFSGDGTKLAYQSTKANYVDPNYVNGATQIIVYDLIFKARKVASTNLQGELGDKPSLSPSLSFNGNEVFFMSSAENFDDEDRRGASLIYRKKLDSSELTVLNRQENGDLPNGTTYSFALSSDSKRIAFASSATKLIEGQRNGGTNIFLKDVDSLEIVNVTKVHDGSILQGPVSSIEKGAFSADGSKLIITSAHPSLVVTDTNSARRDVFVVDLDDGSCD